MRRSCEHSWVAGAARVGNISDWIASLDDETAARALKTFSAARLGEGQCQPQCTPELRAVLEEHFSSAGPDTTQPSEGELARRALRVLAQDAELAEQLRTLASGSVAQKMTVDAAEIGIVTAALVALQTHVDIERDKDGRWRLRIRKPSASEDLLKARAQAFLGFLGGGPSRGAGHQSNSR